MQKAVSSGVSPPASPAPPLFFCSLLEVVAVGELALLRQRQELQKMVLCAWDDGIPLCPFLGPVLFRAFCYSLCSCSFCILALFVKLITSFLCLFLNFLTCFHKYFFISSFFVLSSCSPYQNDPAATTTISPAPVSLYLLLPSFPAFFLPSSFLLLSFFLPFPSLFLSSYPSFLASVAPEGS